MLYRVALSQSAFEELIRGFTIDRRGVSVCAAGLSSSHGVTELLLHRVQWDPAATSAANVAIWTSDDPARLEIPSHMVANPRTGRPNSAFLCLGVGRSAGHVTGGAIGSRGIEPLDQMRLIAAGLPSVRPSANVVESSYAKADWAKEMWSRSIGVLGEDLWRKIASLNIAVIGCGRTGSLVATGLARIGVQSLTLIDPDVLELHNVGEMDAVSDKDVGMPKVEAVAVALSKIHQGQMTHIECVTDSIFSHAALLAVKSADVLICCVDDAAARIASDFLAKLYLKPLIDIGTGALTTRRMGADIRLVLPGRCLLCFGGVARLHEARRNILGERPEVARSSGPVDWRAQRAGSLRSLNQIAVGFALRLFEEFLGGQIGRSSWLTLNIGENGIPALENIESAAPDSCSLCAMTGRGDVSLDQLPVLI